MPIEFIFRFFLQILVSIAIIAITIASGGSESYMILAFPFFLGIPAALFTFIVLIPAETFLRTINKEWHSFYLVPLIAAMIPWLMFPFRGDRSDFVSASESLSIFTLCWGLLWMATKIVYRSPTILKRLAARETKDAL